MHLNKVSSFGETADNTLPPVFVISLKGDIRRESCRQQLDLGTIPFRFFDAIKGSALEHNDAEASGYDPTLNQRLFKRPLTSAELGCYLSHQALWGQIAANDCPAVILEDDFEIEAGFKENIVKLLRYDLDDKIVKIDSERSKGRRGVDIQTLGDLTIKQYAVVTPRTTAYLIGPQAAARMLAARKRFYRPVDIDLKFLWEHRVPVMTVDPPLVRERVVERAIFYRAWP